jgi:hypothetical protein
MKFQVILPKPVQKELGRLPDEIARRVLARLTGLETNPRPPDVKNLKAATRGGFALAITGWFTKSMTAFCKSSSSPSDTGAKYIVEIMVTASHIQT